MYRNNTNLMYDMLKDSIIPNIYKIDLNRTLMCINTIYIYINFVELSRIPRIENSIVRYIKQSTTLHMLRKLFLYIGVTNKPTKLL